MALVACLTITTSGAAAPQSLTDVDASFRKLKDPLAGVFVVAHRGCHNSAPKAGLTDAPENSLLALDHCAQLGVDMMETDVRRSKDGVLVIMHDTSVDRTTNGRGRVSDLTLAELKALRLRQNTGGATNTALTDQFVVTLDEMLEAARGRLMLNLDIKEEIYPDVVAAVLRADMSRQILIKREVNLSDPVLAKQHPYDQANFIPIINSSGLPVSPSRVCELLRRQTGRGERLTVGAEVVYLDPMEMQSAAKCARENGIRLWGNSLTSAGVVAVTGLGGDLDALRDPAHWERLLSSGLSIIQTDEPAALLDYLKTRMVANSGVGPARP